MTRHSFNWPQHWHFPRWCWPFCWLSLLALDPDWPLQAFADFLDFWLFSTLSLLGCCLSFFLGNVKVSDIHPESSVSGPGDGAGQTWAIPWEGAAFILWLKGLWKGSLCIDIYQRWKYVITDRLFLWAGSFLQFYSTGVCVHLRGAVGQAPRRGGLSGLRLALIPGSATYQQHDLDNFLNFPWPPLLPLDTIDKNVRPVYPTGLSWDFTRN